MARAIWNGVLLAESAETEIVEGNHYFPEDTVNREYFQESETKTVCSWKGVASYYDVVVGDEVNSDAAWFYPTPSDDASNITNYVAFWNGVTVED